VGLPDLSDIAGVERLLTTRLAQPLPGAEAHLRMAPRPHRDDWRPDDLPSRAHRAAVLVLLYEGPRGVTLPLTVRHSDLPHHPGQVSLPGGRIDVDETAEHAALREAYEEIGVPVDAIRIVGSLSTLWVIVSNHVVQPFVGVADARPDFVLAAREVESLVEVPLADLHDTRKMGSERRRRDGVEIDVPYFELEGHRVWGATGMILAELREALASTPDNTGV
jgi:8-oxo-dGTP pyrophosphatase MutT (NUDIX family)